MITFWIARNKGEWGGLWLYSMRPTPKLDGTFVPSVCDPHYRLLDKNEYPEVTPENSPVEFELTIKKK